MVFMSFMVLDEYHEDMKGMKREFTELSNRVQAQLSFKQGFPKAQVPLPL
jgi:hypothetical protein